MTPGKAAPMVHVARASLPWRSEHKTECGKDAAEFAQVLTRDQFAEKVKTQGQQRAAMSTCMTCWHTALRRTDWAHSPSSVIERNAQDAMFSRESDSQLDRELRAIAALIEAHRDEFDAFLAGLDQATSLVNRRQARRIGGPR